MIPHNKPKFKANLPVCVGNTPKGRCPQCLQSICMVDNVPCAHHANAGYCPKDKFSGGICKPKDWDLVEKQSTGIPFTPETQASEIVPQIGGVWPTNDKWAKWPNAQAAYRIALANALQAIPAYPADKYYGKGIVICAGGALLEAAYVSIKVLRFIGCTLPVELWHLPNERLEDWHLAAFQGLGVTIINAGDIAKEFPMRRTGGWELKAYAVLHSRYRHILSLDADCYPVRCPAALFDSPQYREYGAIFWPDKTEYDLTKEQCEILGISHINKPDIESGEFFVDKQRNWKELTLTNWINQHSDYYYQIFHGDKTSFRLAWEHLNTPYSMPGPARWEYRRPAMVQKDFNGYPLFIHRSEGKLTLVVEGGNIFGNGRTGQFPIKERYNPQLPLENIAWRFVDELREICGRYHNHGYIFGGIYARNEWGNGSGPGSAPAATAEYRALLEKIIHSGRIKRVVDLGCGDWQFSKLVNWKGVEYLGVDCVKSLVAENSKRYGAPNIRFQHADLMEFDPPPCDLILVKDVLQHWPTADVRAFLARTAGREMLITNTVEQPGQRAVNSDIKAGDFRPLDITAAPYSVARAKPLLDWVVGVDDHKQTLHLPGPVSVVRGVKGIARALMVLPGNTVADNRREICEQCDKAIRALGIFEKCGVCSCVISAKSKNPAEACPLGKWPKVGTSIAFVQLGRAGDILILIPALKFWAQTGVTVKLITRPEYAPVAAGIPGIEVIEWQGKIEDWQGAEKLGRTLANEVRVTQCGFNNRKRVQPNFALEGFYHTGVPVSFFNTLPLVLENRNAETERQIAAAHAGEILFNANGHSTPYIGGPELLAELWREFGQGNVVDLGGIKAPRIQDLLGLYERAKCLISTDTATLHLGYATGTPTVALVSDSPGGASPTRPHWVERLTYAETKTQACKARLFAAVAGALNL